MKTMYLHIGTPKTATTAIQTFCNENQNALKENGYIFPVFPYDYGSIQQFRNGHFLIDGLYGKNWRERKEAADQVFVEGFGQIYEMFKEYDNIILSDEGIWNHSFLRDASFWKRMEGELKKGLFQLKIVVYLRRQDDFLFSWWNQQVKEGNVMAADSDWNELVETMPMIRLDYYEMLEQIAGKVGKENLIVRVFEKDKLYGGNIYADFLNAVGLELTQNYKMISQLSNPSLTKDNIEIKRIVNTLGVSPAANSFFRKILTEQSEQETVVKKDRRCSMFSKEEFEDFMKNYQEGNDRVAKEYLNRECLFDNVYKAESKWEPDTHAMLQTTISLMGEMMSYTTSENDKLKKQISELQKETKGLQKEVKNLRYELNRRTLSYKVKAVIRRLKKLFGK